MQSDEINELKERRISLKCVREAHLSAQIDKAQEIGTCDYCGAEDVPTMSIEELAGEVSSAFERHFQRTATDPDGLEYSMIKEGLLNWDRHGDPVALVISKRHRLMMKLRSMSAVSSSMPFALPSIGGQASEWQQ